MGCHSESAQDGVTGTGMRVSAGNCSWLLVTVDGLRSTVHAQGLQEDQITYMGHGALGLYRTK